MLLTWLHSEMTVDQACQILRRENRIPRGQDQVCCAAFTSMEIQKVSLMSAEVRLIEPYGDH